MAASRSTGNAASPVGAAEVDPGLTVSGCSDQTVAPIIRGKYVVHSSNHGKFVYRNLEKFKGLDVLLYFWDDRDDAAFSGWWFGPKVGGDHTWAFHPDALDDKPPAAGWRCPFDAPVDPSILVLGKSSVQRRWSKRSEDPAASPPAPQPHPQQPHPLDLRWSAQLRSQAEGGGSRQQQAPADTHRLQPQRPPVEAASWQDDFRSRQDDPIKPLVDKLTSLVEAVESGTDSLRAFKERLTHTTDLRAETAASIGTHIAETTEWATGIHKEYHEFVKSNRAALDTSQNVSRSEIAKLVRRADAAAAARGPATRQAELALADAVERAAEAQRAAAGLRAAQEHMKHQRSVFRKYDVDGDGLLNRMEIAAYATGECGFEISPPALDRVLGKPDLSEWSGAVHMDAFQSLRVAIGIEREIARDTRRRMEKERHARQLREQLEAWRGGLAALLSEAGALEARISGTAAEVGRLARIGGSSSAADMAREMESSWGVLESAGAAVRDICERVQGFRVDALDPEFRAYLRAEAAGAEEGVDGLAEEVDRLKSTFDDAIELHAAFRACVATKRCLEVDEVHMRIAEIVQTHLGLGPRGGGGGGAAGLVGDRVARDDFLAFARGHWNGGTRVQPDFPEAAAVQWFNGQAERASGAGAAAGGAAELSRFDLLRPVRVRYRVVSAVALTDGLCTSESRVLRGLRVGELFELREGPLRDEETSLTRLHGHAVRDGRVGFVTVQGNQGTSYLERCQTAPDISPTGCSREPGPSGSGAEDAGRAAPEAPPACEGATDAGWAAPDIPPNCGRTGSAGEAPPEVPPACNGRAGASHAAPQISSACDGTADVSQAAPGTSSACNGAADVSRAAPEISPTCDGATDVIVAEICPAAV